MPITGLCPQGQRTLLRPCDSTACLLGHCCVFHLLSFRHQFAAQDFSPFCSLTLLLSNVLALRELAGSCLEQSEGKGVHGEVVYSKHGWILRGGRNCPQSRKRPKFHTTSFVLEENDEMFSHGPFLLHPASTSRVPEQDTGQSSLHQCSSQSSLHEFNG